MNIKSYLLVGVLAIFASGAMAKIPPPPPLEPAAAAAKAEKDKAAAEKAKADADKGKADLARYEDKAVASFQSNMRKAGKPVPKPTPVVVAAAPAPAGAVAGKAVPAGPAKSAPVKK